MKALFKIMISLVLLATVLSTPVLAAPEETDDVSDEQAVSSDLPFDAIPDLSEEESGFPVAKGNERNFVIVPIPMSSPTFGTGLIVGGAYYYSQTEEQKASQPASFTGAAAGYTTNESYFGGVMQQNYFKEDSWRFNALAAYVDFKLELVPPVEGSEEGLLDWLVKGGIAQTSVAKRIGGQWFLGVMARYLDIEQDLDLNIDFPDFNLAEQINSPGAGLTLEYDTRDKPSNAYSGRRFELKAIAADQRQRDDGSYQSYYARFRSYHQLMDSLVVAWEVNGCSKSGVIPLWDTCRLPLRGFPITQYLGGKSIYGQAEARWRFHKRWGLVAFAGAGRIGESLGDNGEGETIPSYGVGLRFMVLESQRINVRIDYARSDNGNSAWYLGVTEAF